MMKNKPIKPIQCFPDNIPPFSRWPFHSPHSSSENLSLISDSSLKPSPPTCYQLCLQNTPQSTPSPFCSLQHDLPRFWGSHPPSIPPASWLLSPTINPPEKLFLKNAKDYQRYQKAPKCISNQGGRKRSSSELALLSTSWVKM